MPSRPRKQPDTSKMLLRLFAAAKAHGEESESDHEIGDLQGILYSCWARLSHDARREVFASHAELISDYE